MITFNGSASAGVSVAGPMTPQRSGVRAHVRARSGCAEVGGTRRRPRGAGRLAGTDRNCPGEARSVSRAHSAAGAPTQIRGWARTGVSTCGGRGRRLHCAAWCLVVCPRRRARPKPHSPPAAGEGGGFTARRGRVSAQFLLAPTIHPHAPTFLAYHACTLVLSSVYVGSTVFRVLLLYSVIHPRRAHVFCGPSPHAPQGSVGEGKARGRVSPRNVCYFRSCNMAHQGVTCVG